MNAMWFFVTVLVVLLFGCAVLFGVAMPRWRAAWKKRYYRAELDRAFAAFGLAQYQASIAFMVLAHSAIAAGKAADEFVAAMNGLGGRDDTAC